MTAPATAPTPRCYLDAQRNAYVLDGRLVPRVSQVLELGGLEATFSAPAHIRAAALERGTFVHEATMFLDKGTLDWTDLDPGLAPFVRAWQRCRESEPFQIDATEEVVYFAEGERACAGTLDRRGTWQGRPCIVDLKHGKQVYWPTRYQLALYVAGYLYGQGVPVSRETFAAVERRAVWLRDDGRYECVAPYTDAEDLDDVLAALRTAHVRLRHEPKLLTARRG